MDKGFFGRLFDLDGDGKLDFFERSLDYFAFETLVLNEEKEENEDNAESDSNDWIWINIQKKAKW